MSLSSVTGANNVVPLLDPGNAPLNDVNTQPPKQPETGGSQNISANVTAKVPPAPGTGKLVDKMV